MASMHKFIVEGMKAGWLIECEGVTFGTTGVRVHKAASGEVTVTDGPFAETKEVLGGYALLNAASKEEAVEHTRRFLHHVGQGTCEGTWEGAQDTHPLLRPGKKRRIFPNPFQKTPPPTRHPGRLSSTSPPPRDNPKRKAGKFRTR